MAPKLPDCPDRDKECLACRQWMWRDPNTRLLAFTCPCLPSRPPPHPPHPRPRPPRAVAPRPSRSRASARPSACPTSSTTRSRSGRCTRSARTTYDELHAVEDVSVEIAAGRVLRHRRAQRQRQEHAAEVPRRHLRHRRGPHLDRRPALAVHRAGRRLQPGPDGARQRDHQRDHARAHAASRRGSASTRSSPSPSSRSSSTCG